MLALASMQIEPNIRQRLAVDWALHKRWIAIEGKDRAMLAAAIAANGNVLDLPEEVRALAEQEALDEAVIWGLAVRLARRLGAGSRRSLQESRLTIENETLILRIAEAQGALFGISTEKDLKLLADQLGLKWDAQIVPSDQLRNRAD